MTDILRLIVEAVQYDFILKALLVGSLVAVSCSLLGLFLILRRFSMIGDGLAHVSFASIALALLLSASPLLVSIPLVALASVLILKLNEKTKIYGDAAIGLVSSLAVAIGVLIASVSKGFNADLLSYLFGSILVIGNAEIIVSIVLSVSIILIVIILYNYLFAVTYDQDFASVIGIRAKTVNYLIAVLTAVTIAIGIRVVGTMLISSMIIFPTVSAMQLTKGFKTTILVSAVISVFCVIAGIFTSFVFNLPTGAVIVVLNAAVFILCILYGRITR